MSRKVERQVVDEVIDEFIRQRVLPNLLLEILKSAEDRILASTPVDVHLQLFLPIYECLLDEVIKEECAGTLADIRNDFVKTYLYADRRRQYLCIPDAGQALCQEILDDVIADECHIAVKMCVRDFVDNYLKNARSEDLWMAICEEVVQEVSRELCVDAIQARRAKKAAELIIREHVDDEVFLIVQEMEAQRGVRIARTDAELHVMRLVDTTAGRIAEKAILERVLEHVQLQTRNPLVPTEISDIVLEGLVLDNLLRKYVGLTELLDELESEPPDVSALQKTLAAEAVMEKLLLPHLRRACAAKLTAIRNAASTGTSCDDPK